MTFRGYLLEELGRDWQSIQMDLIHEGYSEDEINEHHTELRDDFESYLEDNEIEEVPE